MQHWHDDPDKNVSVLVGWDTPLQYFFCVVYPFTKDKHHLEEHLYSNLDEPDGDSVQSLHHYQKILADRFNVTLPEALVTMLLEEQLNNQGPKRLPFFV